MGDFSILGIEVSLGTMIYQAVIFTVLFWALHKLFLNKIVDALENRKNHIANQLQMTEQYKEEAKEKLVEQTILLAQARKDVIEMRRLCKKETDLILKNAKEEAYQIRFKAYEEKRKMI